MTRKVAKRAKTTQRSSGKDTALPTLMDHLHELQSRLFSTVLVFILVAGAAYPFFDKIAAMLMAPLKKGQELVYLTPGGAFSFIIKVCVYIGIIGTLPIIIFHIYRFVMPAAKKVHLRTVLKYTVSSLFLAICGIIFAYYVSLPASLYFLTSFDLNHINPMLTIDAYFSFVMTYLLAGALLFQLPLVMLIVNSVKPLTPKKLMSKQRHMILISFIVAAVISPTPDALNQTLLASPVVVMYQLGIIMIWLTNRRRSKREKAVIVAKTPVSSVAMDNGFRIDPSFFEELPSTPTPRKPVVRHATKRLRADIQAPAKTNRLVSKPVVSVLTPAKPAIKKPMITAPMIMPGMTKKPVRSMDMTVTRTSPVLVPPARRTAAHVAPPQRISRTAPRLSSHYVSPFRTSTSGSIDGMMIARRAI